MIRKFGIRKYQYYHFILLLLPLLFFPGRQLPEIFSHQGITLVMDVFLGLSFAVGVVFFVLSTISIISQSWLANSGLSGRNNPFTLYAFSNLGSFLSLLTYPFIFEYYFDLNLQVKIWRGVYLLFLILYIITLKKIRVIGNCGFGEADNQTGSGGPEYNAKSVGKLYWFLLSAAGCVLFLSVTNVVTYEITPCPLIWIIPLCIYLISFVLTFRQRPFCPEWIKGKMHLWLGFSLMLFFLAQRSILPILLIISAYFVSLFVMCLFCQYKLYQSRPRENKYLTTFYLIIALGGFIGSFLVIWLAPLVFTSPLEYLFGLFIIALALKMREESVNRVGLFHLLVILLLVLTLFCWPLVFRYYNFFGLVILLCVFAFAFGKFNRKFRPLFLAMLAILLLSPLAEIFWSGDGVYLYALRNYYGIYRIQIKGGFIYLYNGTTLHGAQSLSKNNELEPLTYYHRDTPVGKFINSRLFSSGRTGIIGLGVGTLAAYGQSGESIDFYELDPDTFKLAQEFRYLKNSKAKLNYIFGDARVALKRSGVKDYDTLIVDAFSGDSVPFHLLTTEAIKEYKTHLKDKGVILFHISNRYLDLSPVLFSNAKVSGAYAVIGSNDADDGKAWLSRSIWVALTWDKDNKDILVSKLNWREEGPKFKVKAIRPWTDKYSNILSVFKPRHLIESVRKFMPFYW